MAQVEDIRGVAPDEVHGEASSWQPGWAKGLAGALAAALALGVAELLAGVIALVPSLVTVVGDGVIDVGPPMLIDLGIALFGTGDKTALQVGTVVLAIAAGVVVGLLAARRFLYGVLGFSAFAVLGVVATAAAPQASPVGAAIGAVAGSGTGLAALWVMLRQLGQHREEPVREASVDRRAFLRTAGVAGVAALGAGAVGRMLASSDELSSQIADSTLPQVATGQPTPPPGTTVEVASMPPLYTPNSDFYRIDTALTIPRVDVTNWTLSVNGLVDNPTSITYDDLLAEADMESDVTLACVSNEVGGGLVGNAAWFGVPLARVLERAGVQPSGTQIVGRSVDGFTVSFPTEIALDGRDAMIAVGMNGEPLPARHGFPARLIVPGLYGYVSATKWLQDIELVTDDFDAYWIPRGWAKEGPIKTQSRIDVPTDRTQVQAGTVALAGVAWAPTRGIERVEVQVDEAEWVEAELAEALNVTTWRQWVYRWEASAGSHRVKVRATDAEGEVQTDELAPPRPDGATGLHTITVEVV